jgi:hypothetical protein
LCQLTGGLEEISVDEAEREPGFCSRFGVEHFAEECHRGGALRADEPLDHPRHPAAGMHSEFEKTGDEFRLRSHDADVGGASMVRTATPASWLEWI